MEDLLLYCLQVYFAYYLLNHASILDRVRGAVVPIVPRWIRNLVSCPLCITFWFTLAAGLTVGSINYLLLCAPPVVLLIDTLYRYLKGPKEPPVLPRS